MCVCVFVCVGGRKVIGALNFLSELINSLLMNSLNYVTVFLIVAHCISQIVKEEGEGGGGSIERNWQSSRILFSKAKLLNW